MGRIDNRESPTNIFGARGRVFGTRCSSLFWNLVTEENSYYSLLSLRFSSLFEIFSRLVMIKRMKYILPYLGTSVLLHCFVSCASSVPKKQAVKDPVFSIPKFHPAKKNQAKTPLDKVTEGTLPIKYKKEHYDFWMNYFTKRERDRFQRHLNNGDRFRKIVESILEYHDLPSDIYFVGLIESGYNLYAKSFASAVGPWQFMRGTARQYGMRIDRYVDERRNIIKATHGAAKYFKDLYNILGSWELALCAYNAGENRIISAIRRGKTRDYRELVQKKLIPKETIYYIPKLAAAREISLNRERYGFSYGKADKDFAEIDELTLKKSFHWKKSVQGSGIASLMMKKLNPDIKGNRVKVVGSFKLIVPKGGGFRVVSLEKGTYLDRRIKNLGTNKIGKIYTVRPGDYLLKIARAYRTSVEKIMETNGLESDSLYVNQKIRIPPKVSQRIYVVKKGDNLFGIAKKFNSTIQTIVAFNELKTQKIFPNQKLYIPVAKYF